MIEETKKEIEASNVRKGTPSRRDLLLRTPVLTSSFKQKKSIPSHRVASARPRRSASTMGGVSGPQV